MPKVYNKRDSNIPKGAVYIGRPSKFGNRFAIGADGTREEVCAKYKAWIMSDAQVQLRESIRIELKGKDVICFCAPLQCHGDTILKIAND